MIREVNIKVKKIKNKNLKRLRECALLTLGFFMEFLMEKKNRILICLKIKAYML